MKHIKQLEYKKMKFKTVIKSINIVLCAETFAATDKQCILYHDCNIHYLRLKLLSPLTNVTM